MADMQMRVEELFMEIGKLTIMKNKLEARVAEQDQRIAELEKEGGKKK